MRLHVETLFTLTEEGLLDRVNEPGGGSAPRIFLGHTGAGLDVWFRTDVDPSARSDIERHVEGMTLPGPPAADSEYLKPVLIRLAEEAPISREWAGPVFRCTPTTRGSRSTAPVTTQNADVLTRYFSDWLEDVEQGVPFHAVLEDGAAVSICCSVRVGPAAHEAGVETHPDFRGRGYGAAAVAAWADTVASGGSIPLYSTSWTNTASISVARKLGLRHFGSDLHLS